MAMHSLAVLLVSTALTLRQLTKAWLIYAYAISESHKLPTATVLTTELKPAFRCVPIIKTGHHMHMTHAENHAVIQSIPESAFTISMGAVQPTPLI